MTLTLLIGIKMLLTDIHEVPIAAAPGIVGAVLLAAAIALVAAASPSGFGGA